MKKIDYLLFIIYKIIFDWIYIEIVSVNFEYMGQYKDINISKYIIGWGIFLLIFPLINFFIKKRSSLYIIDLLIIFSVLPQISLWGIKNYTNTSIIYMMIYWFIFIISTSFLDRMKLKSNQTIYKKEKKINRKQLSNKVITIIIMLFSSLLIIYISGRYAGFRFTLSFDDIYLYREEYNSIDKTGIINYLLPLTSSVLLPYIFMVYIIEKKTIMVIYTMFIAVLSFSISGMKTWLCIYLIVFFICVYIKENKGNIIRYLLCGLIGFSIFAGVIYYGTGSINLIGLHNRVLGYPSELNFYYFNFFNNNEFLYLRESILRYFSDSPYMIKASYLISHAYGGDVGYTNNAVNGLFGDAYANFGVIGIILYPVALAIIMRIFIGLCEYYEDNRYAYCIGFILIWNTLNTSFFTWLLTGGVLLFYLILYINKNDKGLRLKI